MVLSIIRTSSNKKIVFFGFSVMKVS